MKSRSFVVRGLTSLARFVENLAQSGEETEGSGAAQRSGKASVTVQFRRRDRFFTPSEEAFYTRLQEAVGPHLLIMSKVRLIDLIEPVGDEQQRFLGFARSAQKHLDFVLLRPQTYEVVAAIELDGSSHGRSRQARRDEQKARILESAGIPLLRFSSLEVLPVEMIRQRLLTFLPGQYPPQSGARPASEQGAGSLPQPSGGASQTEEAPKCFKCGRTMVLKRKKGESFWACPGFPRCRNTFPARRP